MHTANDKQNQLAKYIKEFKVSQNRHIILKLKKSIK